MFWVIKWWRFSAPVETFSSGIPVEYTKKKIKVLETSVESQQYYILNSPHLYLQYLKWVWKCIENINKSARVLGQPISVVGLDFRLSPWNTRARGEILCRLLSINIFRYVMCMCVRYCLVQSRREYVTTSIGYNVIRLRFASYGAKLYFSHPLHLVILRITRKSTKYIQKADVHLFEKQIPTCWHPDTARRLW